MAVSISSLECGYVAPWFHFASFALSVPITVTSASGYRVNPSRRGPEARGPVAKQWTVMTMAATVLVTR